MNETASTIIDKLVATLGPEAARIWPDAIAREQTLALSVIVGWVLCTLLGAVGMCITWKIALRPDIDSDFVAVPIVLSCITGLCLFITIWATVYSLQALLHPEAAVLFRLLGK